MNNPSMSLPCRGCGQRTVTIGIGTLYDRERLLQGGWRYCDRCKANDTTPPPEPIAFDLPHVRRTAARELGRLRRRGVEQAQTCPDVAQAARLMGRLPVAPPGECTQAALALFILSPDDSTLCHAPGISLWPEREGQPAVHGWIERDGQAHNTVWGHSEPAAERRKKQAATFQAGDVIEYSRTDASWLWKRYGGDVWHLPSVGCVRLESES